MVGDGKLKRVFLVVGALVLIGAIIGVYVFINSILPHSFTTTLTGFQTQTTSGFYAAGGQAQR